MKKMTTTIIVLTVVIMGLGLAPTASWGAWNPVFLHEDCETSIIMVHEAPSIKSKVIGRLYFPYYLRNRKILWDGRAENWWIFVKDPTDGLEGWVLSDFFNTGLEAEYVGFEKPVIYICTIKDFWVNERVEPTIIYKTCDSVYPGQEVQIIGRQGAWLHTRDRTWVYHEYFVSKSD